MPGISFWIKSLGSVFVLLVGFSGGGLLASELEKELEELTRLELALTNLSTEISYSLSALPKALCNAGTKAGGNTGIFFRLMGELSGMEQRRTVEEAYFVALEQTRELRLPEHELQTLKTLVKNLGVWGSKEQIGFIDMALNQSRNYKASIQAEYLKKAKMYRSLGVLFALGIVTVLL